MQDHKIKSLRELSYDRSEVITALGDGLQMCDAMAAHIQKFRRNHPRVRYSTRETLSWNWKQVESQRREFQRELDEITRVEHCERETPWWVKVLDFFTSILGMFLALSWTLIYYISGMLVLAAAVLYGMWKGHAAAYFYAAVIYWWYWL